MKIKENQFRSLLMCAALVLTMLPADAFAASRDPMSTPLLEAWTNIAQFSSDDIFHSVPWCTDIAVNDGNPSDNPDVYVTTNTFNYAVIKGSYSNGTYTFNELGGTEKPTFDQYNQPVSLVIDGGYYDKDIYVSTNNMTTVGKVWKFDGANCTDITYGIGMNAPLCLPIRAETCLQLTARRGNHSFSGAMTRSGIPTQSGKQLTFLHTLPTIWWQSLYRT